MIPTNKKELIEESIRVCIEMGDMTIEESIDAHLKIMTFHDHDTPYVSSEEIQSIKKHHPELLGLTVK